MQKIFTPVSRPDITEIMEPAPETLQKILNFAAAYRAVKMNENQSLDIILN